MSQSKKRFRDKYPEYIDFVVDPDTTGVFEIIDSWDIIKLFYERSTKYFEEKELDKFIDRCSDWGKNKQAKLPDGFFENYMEFHMFFTDNQGEFVEYFIKIQLKKKASKGEKLNYLNRVKADVLQKEFYSNLEYDREELVSYIDAEISVWKEYIEPKGATELIAESSTLNEIKNTFKEELEKKTIKPKRKIMLLNELGIIDHLNNHYNLDGNYTKIGKILKKVITVDVTADTLRTYIEAIKKPSEKNKQNDPYNGPGNKIWLESELVELKLPKMG